MHYLAALPFVIASLLLMRGMDRLWMQSGKYVEMMRFPGNEAAKRNYETKRDAGGHGARPARIQPDPVELSRWLDDGGAIN